MAEEQVTVFMKDIRSLKMCSAGTRSFFERHGLDWSRFLKEGLPAEQFEAIDDHMSQQVAEAARGRRGK